jgi:hypothetical protein
VSEDVERLSPDDLAFWRALLAEADGARRAVDVAARHLARKYLLGPTRRLAEDGSIEVSADSHPRNAQGGGRTQ